MILWSNVTNHIMTTTISTDEFFFPATTLLYDINYLCKKCSINCKKIMVIDQILNRQLFTHWLTVNIPNCEWNASHLDFSLQGGLGLSIGGIIKHNSTITQVSLSCKIWLFLLFMCLFMFCMFTSKHDLPLITDCLGTAGCHRAKKITPDPSSVLRYSHSTSWGNPEALPNQMGFEKSSSEFSACQGFPRSL